MKIPTHPIEVSPPSVRKRHYSLRRLAIKELRETLRDRRTIVTLIAMPLLVYPILSLVFRSFLFSNAALFGNDGPIVLDVAYAGTGTAEQTTQMLGWIGNALDKQDQVSNQATEDPAKPNQNPDAQERESRDFVPLTQQRWTYFDIHENHLDATDPIRQVVAAGKFDVGVFFETTNVGKGQWQIGSATIISRDDRLSRAAADFLQANFDNFNRQSQSELLARAGLPVAPALEIHKQSLKSPDDDTADADGEVSLASLIPLILVLMTITGAVYPAIDLTAGEKERGTLEMLMAAPLPRIAILTGKFVAVLTVAVLTALLNLIGMAATVWAFQLDQFLAGSGAFTWLVLLKVFLLLVLFAAFFSALLLAVTSYARSFKEAQSYLVPIILLSLGPGLLAMTPGIRLDGPWAIAPMMNLLLLARDVIQNQVHWIPAMVAIASTIVYGWLAILWAARSFGSDAILYQSHGSFVEMFSRPKCRQMVVPLSVVIFCLLLLFPMNFVMIGVLGRVPSESLLQLTFRFLLMNLFTALSFFIFPYLVARYQKTKMVTGFALRSGRFVFWLAAILLGVSLWPLVMGMVSGWHEVYGWIAGAEQSSAWHDQLVAETSAQVGRIRQLSPWIVLMSLSIIPAFCEEWFFRGMLLRSLLHVRSSGSAIVLSAVIFGLFHGLSNSVIALDRVLPTMLVGIVLAYLAYKSNSIWPGMLLHSLHNAAVSFLAYYQPQLSKFDWFPGEDAEIPGWWIAVAATIAFVGIGLIMVAKRKPEPPPVD